MSPINNKSPVTQLFVDTPRVSNSFALPDSADAPLVPDAAQTFVCPVVPFTVFGDVFVNDSAEEAPPVSPTPASAAAAARGNGVVVTFSDGSLETRTGGTRAWRNHNPGNIVPGPFADRHGAIGRAGGFAVFPDEATGAAAQKALLLGSKNQNRTIDEMIKSYAPPSENDTAAYQRFVQRNTGLSGNTKMSDLTDEQLDALLAVMRRKEGWKEGTVTHSPAPTPANSP